MFGGVMAVLLNPFTYTTNGGAITITGYNPAGGSNVVIPSSINGYPVTSIGFGAFSGAGITSVTIPASVTNIEDNSFQYCPSLTNVIIGNGVTSIGYQAFYVCTSLTSVTLGNGVTSIGSEAFLYCTNLTSVVIPAIPAARFDAVSRYHNLCKSAYFQNARPMMHFQR